MTITDAQSQKDAVEDYYGNTLSDSSDLKTTACCPVGSMPTYLKEPLKKIHPEIQDKFYGCGSPIPFGLEGKTVLDLGCGTGRDAYLVSQMVGESGKVIGVDMTANQLDVATSHIDYHMSAFGYETPNVTFHHGHIEDLASIGIADNSVDVVISNCVINLSPDKAAVFKEIFRVLKPGGELYFSDVFSDRRLPEALQKDPVLVGECLGGALYLEDFRRLLNEFGCHDYRIVSRGPIDLTDPALLAQAGAVTFESITIRTFKCDFEDICEDYGHTVTYKGGLSESPDTFVLDDHHTFNANQPERVCGNTYKMITETHYAPFFEVTGDFSTHLGTFNCSPAEPAQLKASSGGCC